MKNILIGIQLLISFLAALVLLSVLLGYNDTSDNPCVPSDSTFTITLNANGGNIDEYTINAKHGSIIQHEINHIGGNMVDANIHYVLDGWTINSTSGSRLTYDDTLERNIILFAVWEEAISYEVTVVITPEASDIHDITVPEDMIIYNGTPLLSFIEERIEVDILNSRYQQYTWYYRSVLDDTGEYRPVTSTTRMPNYDINIKIVPTHTHRRLSARVIHDDAIDDISSNIIQENDPEIYELYDYVSLSLTTFTNFENVIRQMVEESIAVGFEDYFILEFTNDFNSSNSDDVIITVTISLSPLRQMFEITVDLNTSGVIGAPGSLNPFSVIYGTPRETVIEMLDIMNITSTSHDLTGWSGIPEVITSDVTIVAIWTIITSTVTIDLGETNLTNQTGDTSVLTVDFGTTRNELLELLNARNITSDSHKLTSWEGIPEIVTKDVTVTAQWTIKTFYVTIKLGDVILSNQTGDTSVLTVDFGTTRNEVLELLNARNITSDSHKLTSWEGIPEIVTKDVTVTAQWTDINIPFNVEFRVDGVVIGNRTFTVGEVIAMLDITDYIEGRSFLGWYLEQHGLIEEGNGFEMPARNIRLDATWANEYFRLSFVTEFERNATDFYGVSLLESHAGTPIDSRWVSYNTNILDFIGENNITTTHSTVGGFQFGTNALGANGWMYNWWSPGSGNQQFLNNASLMPASDLTIYSNWTRRNRLGGGATITAVTHQGTLSGSALTNQDMWYYHNLLHLIHRGAGGQRQITRPGFIFVGWYVVEFGIIVSDDNENRHFRMPAQHITIEAQWEVDLSATFTINFDTGTEISINPIPNISVETSILEAISNIDNPTRQGYTFLGWLFEDEVLTTQRMPIGDITLVANWAADILITAHIHITGVINRVEEIYVQYAISGLELSNLIYEQFLSGVYNPLTHEFSHFSLNQAYLSSIPSIQEDISITSVVNRHSAIITLNSSLVDIINGYLILEVGVNLFDELQQRGIATLEDAIIDGITYRFDYWYYSSSFGTGIVDVDKTVPYSDPTLVAIFVIAEGEDKVIMIYSDVSIFNDSNVLILSDLADSLDIREFLLGLRNAMNALFGNTARYFHGITFDVTPGFELVGFYKLDDRNVNILHTNEELSFNGQNQLTFHAIIRVYTERARLTFSNLDNDRVAIAASTPGAHFHALVLPSFHDGRKVVSIIGAVFSARNISEVTFPVYIEEIGVGAFANNNNIRYIHLNGLPRLHTIDNQAFQHLGMGIANRRIFIDAITPLENIGGNAFNGTGQFSVQLLGNWQPSQPPLWWGVRENFNVANRFINAAGNNINDFFN